MIGGQYQEADIKKLFVYKCQIKCQIVVLTSDCRMATSLHFCDVFFSKMDQFESGMITSIIHFLVIFNPTSLTLI